MVLPEPYFSLSDSWETSCPILVLPWTIISLSDSRGTSCAIRFFSEPAPQLCDSWDKHMVLPQTEIMSIFHHAKPEIKYAGIPEKQSDWSNSPNIWIFINVLLHTHTHTHTHGLITCVHVQSEWNIREELMYTREHGAPLEVSIQIVHVYDNHMLYPPISEMHATDSVDATRSVWLTNAVIWQKMSPKSQLSGSPDTKVMNAKGISMRPFKRSVAAKFIMSIAVWERKALISLLSKISNIEAWRCNSCIHS